MGNKCSIPIPRMAFIRLEGAWVAAAGMAGRTAAVAAGPVVVDLSAPARAAGLRPGMRVRSARRLVPELVLARQDEIDPLAALEPFYRLLTTLSPRVEPVLAGLAALIEPDPHQPLEELIAALLAGGAGRWGHRLVVGAGHGRLVARLAAHAVEAGWSRWLDPAHGRVLERPGGRVAPAGHPVAVAGYEVRPGREAAFLAPLPVTALREVPPAARRELVRMGLRTLGDVAAAPREVVARAVGGLAPVLQAWCRGDDRRPLAPGFPPPEIAAEEEAPPELAGEARAGWWPARLPLLARRLAAALQEAGQAGRLLVLAGERATARRYLVAATADAGVLARAALTLYRRLIRDEPDPGRLRLAITGLEAAARQLALEVGPAGAGQAPGDGGAAAGRKPRGGASAPARVPGLPAGEACLFNPAAPLPAGGAGLPVPPAWLEAGRVRQPAVAGRPPALEAVGPAPAGWVSAGETTGPVRAGRAAPAGKALLPALVADLGRRYPGRVFWGRERPASRRERQLAFWDPWRGLARP